MNCRFCKTNADFTQNMSMWSVTIYKCNKCKYVWCYSNKISTEEFQYENYTLSLDLIKKNNFIIDHEINKSIQLNIKINKNKSKDYYTNIIKNYIETKIII